jgi:hypothetical protein
MIPRVWRLLAGYIPAPRRNLAAHPLDAVTTRVGLDADTVDGVDAVVLLTGHDVIDYGVLDRASYVFDARNRLRGHGVERL